jgi:hypothetical protein
MNEGQTDWKKSTWQNVYKMKKHITVIQEVFYITSNSVQRKPVLLHYQELQFWCWSFNVDAERPASTLQR